MNYITTRIRKEIFEFARQLAGQQLDCGAWVAKTPGIVASVITCQAVQLLAGFNIKEFNVITSKAVEWLTSPSVASSEYTYWRYTALFVAEASQGAREDAINHLKEKIEGGVNHHPNSPIKEYYVDCRLKHGALDALANTLVVDFSKQIPSPPKEWGPAKFSYSFTVVVLSGVEKDEAVILRGLEHLTSQSHKMDGQRYWDTLVITAYIITNLNQLIHYWGRNSSLGQKATAIVAEGARYLAKKWEQNDFQSPPLAGGTFEGTAYNKIVVARALIEILDLSEPRWREKEIASFQFEDSSELSTRSSSSSVTYDSETEKHHAKKSHLRHYTNAAMPLFILIVVVFGLLALACILGGIYAIYKGAGDSSTQVDFFVFHLSTTQTGVAFLGIGSATAFFIVKSVLNKIP